MSELQGIARFRFYDGKAEEFKRLSEQCMEIVRAKDTGTLQYEIFLNQEETECVVLERYRDSQALIDHMSNLGGLAEAIFTTGTVSGELLGEPSAARERASRMALSACSHLSRRCRRRRTGWPAVSGASGLSAASRADRPGPPTTSAGFAGRSRPRACASIWVISVTSSTALCRSRTPPRPRRTSAPTPGQRGWAAGGTT